MVHKLMALAFTIALTVMGWSLAQIIRLTHFHPVPLQVTIAEDGRGGVFLTPAHTMAQVIYETHLIEH